MADDASQDESQSKELDNLIAQRVKGTPLAYLTGSKEFYGRDFTVNQHTLMPRPESEDMVEQALQVNMPTVPRVIDIGTGSGSRN